jgi:hypothetical protein
MADDKKTKNTNIHTSYVGTFKADSYAVDDKGVASATLVIPGQDGKTTEKAVKGYNDNVKTLDDAVKAGGEMIIRGTLLGGNKSPHMAIYATGPENLVGKVSKVQDNFETFEKDGKQPYANLWVGLERGEATIFRAVVAYGDDALALKGVAEGDRLEVPARGTHEQRKEKWVNLYRVTGAGTFEPAAEKSKEADETPAP